MTNCTYSDAGDIPITISKEDLIHEVLERDKMIAFLRQKVVQLERASPETNKILEEAKAEANKQIAYANSISNQIEEQRIRAGQWELMCTNLWHHHFNPPKTKPRDTRLVKAYNKSMTWSGRVAKGRLRKFLVKMGAKL